MKHLLKTAISLLLLGTALTGCVRETEINAPTPNGKTAVVTFNVKTPAPTVHRTRSQTTAETTISNIYVLLFDETGAYVDHKIAQTFSPATGTNTESDYQKFDATLPVGDYDIVLLANLNAALAAELATQVAESSPTKSSILNALVYTSAGNPDITDGFPMASLDKEVQEIAPGTASLEFTLIRMVARIDVGFSASNSALNNYTVEAVAFYNHNQKGNVWHGGLTAVPVTTTNIPTTTGKVDDSSYQVNNSGTTPAEKHSFEAQLYALEAAISGSDDTRPCIVVRLSDGTEDLGWYRLDFKSTDGTYSDIIRNNRYIFTISQVTGSGFTDAETAYNAGPKNIVTEVVNWDETEYDNGIFNGVYSILFTGGREVSFSQFGKPESHVLKVKTNLPAITFNNFYESGMPDEEWDEITADQGEFTNEHFTVKIEKDGPDAAEYYTYTLTISAKAAKNADPGDENSSADYPRLTTFWISGDALSADFKVRQEGYENYKLLTETDNNPVSMTGAGGTFDIRVTTTHPYKVSLKPNTTMFAGVWGKDTETGTDVQYYNDEGERMPAAAEGIPATVEVLTVHVGTYTPPADGSPRLGTVEISHVDTESTASGKQHYVMQVDPTITATTDKAELLASGAESATITVESNVPEWTPVLKEVWIGTTQVAEADMYNYVQTLTPALPVYGSLNGTVTFTPAENEELEPIKFVIQIVSSDGNTQSDRITIMQKKAGFVTLPTSGVQAFEYILSVDKNGVLNLDGRRREDNYIVYFKFGSVIAISHGGSDTDDFDPTDVAWVPEGFDTSVITGTAKAGWNTIPYTGGTGFTSEAQVNAVYARTADEIEAAKDGRGDPCKLAEYKGKVGGFVTPSGTTWFESMKTTNSDWTTSYDVSGRWNYGSTVFYPAAGHRSIDRGNMSSVGNYGYYWSSTYYSNTNVYYLRFYNTGVNPSQTSNTRANGKSVRCVAK